MDGADGQDEWFPFVSCVEDAARSGAPTLNVSTACAAQTGLDAEAIAGCYSGSRGTQLQLTAYYETMRLQPPHQWVPWVVVNGQPIYDDVENLATYVCVAYGNQPDKPAACSAVPAPERQQAAAATASRAAAMVAVVNNEDAAVSAEEDEPQSPRSGSDSRRCNRVWDASNGLIAAAASKAAPAVAAA